MPAYTCPHTCCTSSPHVHHIPSVTSRVVALVNTLVRQGRSPHARHRQQCARLGPRSQHCPEQGRHASWSACCAQSTRHQVDVPHKHPESVSSQGASRISTSTCSAKQEPPPADLVAMLNTPRPKGRARSGGRGYRGGCLLDGVAWRPQGGGGVHQQYAGKDVAEMRASWRTAYGGTRGSRRHRCGPRRMMRLDLVKA